MRRSRRVTRRGGNPAISTLAKRLNSRPAKTRHQLPGRPRHTAERAANTATKTAQSDDPLLYPLSYGGSGGRVAGRPTVVWAEDGRDSVAATRRQRAAYFDRQDTALVTAVPGV